MRVYFSHSTFDFGSDYEKEWEKIILDKFPGAEIINPRDIVIPDEDKTKLKGEYKDFLAMMQKYYYPKIDECDVLYAIPYNKTGKYTVGAILEIEYTISKGKRVYKNGVELAAGPFMDDYSKVQKGIRILIGHKYDYPFGGPQYYEIIKNVGMKVQTWESKNFNMQEIRTLHASVYTYDPKLKGKMLTFDKAERREILSKNIVGCNFIIELDAPFESLDPKAERLNFFDYIPQFNEAIAIICKVLDEYDEKYNLMFSGNGIYFCLEGFYDEDRLVTYVEDFIGLVNMLKTEYDLDNRLKVHIDFRFKNQIPWSKYYKIPFQLHEKYNRFSMPIGKGKLDADFIREQSNPDNENSSIALILHKANWEKIW